MMIIKIFNKLNKFFMSDKIDYKLLEELITKRASLLGINLGRKPTAEEEKQYDKVNDQIQTLYFKETVLPQS